MAGGPKYTYPSPRGLDDEMHNIYHDIANPIINNGTASTMTITNLVGTAKADNAATGSIGEYVSAMVGNTNITTTNTGQDIATITLTAGDWDVNGMVKFNIVTATWTQQFLYIATGEPGNSFINSTEYTTQILDNSSSSTTPARTAITVANVRVSIASTTTIQLKVRVLFSAGQPSADGSITARRIR